MRDIYVGSVEDHNDTLTQNIDEKVSNLRISFSKLHKYVTIWISNMIHDFPNIYSRDIQITQKRLVDRQSKYAN